MDILTQIVDKKRLVIERLKQESPLDYIREYAPDFAKLSFREALANGSAINIVAELKRGSPSRGLMIPDFDPVRLAELYREGGAIALSVLTEKEYFYGRYEYLSAAKAAAGLPILCKDFIVDPYQLYHARFMQSDAVLLIVRLLSPAIMAEFIQLADQVGLDCLVEVHNREELEVALECGADIIGVNNRNLTDFSVNLKTSEELAPFIPDSVTRIAESGIFTADDIAHLRKAGYNNFLVGEALVTSDDPVRLLKSLRGV